MAPEVVVTVVPVVSGEVGTEHTEDASPPKLDKLESLSLSTLTWAGELGLRAVDSSDASELLAAVVAVEREGTLVEGCSEPLPSPPPSPLSRAGTAEAGLFTICVED